jgi:hypothetical protein
MGLASPSSQPGLGRAVSRIARGHVEVGQQRLEAARREHDSLENGRDLRHARGRGALAHPLAAAEHRRDGVAQLVAQPGADGIRPRPPPVAFDAGWVEDGVDP